MTTTTSNYSVNASTGEVKGESWESMYAPAQAKLTTQSPLLSELLTALSEAQGELSHASKSSLNPHFKSKYADLSEVIDTFRPVFAKHGLSVVQRNFPCDDGVTVVTTIYHKTGQWLSDGGLHVPAGKRDAQGFGSALTYARRYGLSSMIGIAPDEDDDGNKAAESVSKLSASEFNNVVTLSKKCGASDAEAQNLANSTNKSTYARRVAGLEKRLAEKS